MKAFIVLTLLISFSALAKEYKAPRGSMIECVTTSFDDIDSYTSDKYNNEGNLYLELPKSSLYQQTKAIVTTYSGYMVLEMKTNKGDVVRSSGEKSANLTIQNNQGSLDISCELK